MQFGGKKNMYGVADYLAESSNANAQIGKEVTLSDLSIAPVPQDSNDAPDVLLDGKFADENAAGSENSAVDNGDDDQTTLAVAELDYLRGKLGDRNFGVLSGDDERIVAVFASPGQVGAKAELAQISDAGALIDAFTLLDVLLSDPAAVLSDKRRAVLESLRDATRQRLGEVLGTQQPPQAPVAPGPITVTQCIERMGTKDRAIVALSILVALLVFITGLVFYFRRKCPQ